MSDALVRHLERHVGPVKTVFSEIVPGEPRLDLIHIASTFFRRYELIVTRGMSAQPMTVPAQSNAPRHAEMMVLLPRGWPLGPSAFDEEIHDWPLRLLKTLARHPFQAGTGLGFGHTHANGASPDTVKPYAQNTRLCAVIALPSLTLGEQARNFTRPDGENVALFAAVPLHLSELTYRQTHGLDPFLDRMADRRVSDIVDPTRKPFV